jgi:UDP-N-acetylmuramate dehydrogenase
MLQTNTSLKPHNTFGIDVTAHYYAQFDSVKVLIDLLAKKKSLPIFILGGGSNVLFTQDFKGLVLKNEILGFKTIEDNDNSVVIQAGAGMSWHTFVLKCIDLNYGGIENLSLIPGNIGASPMQNIGAYGVEIKDVFEYLDAVHVETGKVKRFYKADCAFGYRESVFKHELKGEYIICHVAYRLSKSNHKLNTSYGAIENELEKNHIKNPTIKDVSNAVITIRQSKLPDPKEIGNAGSFFKNPVVSKEILEKLLEKYPDIPYYPAAAKAKLAAGWLIEQAGWKGKTFEGRYGVHKKQALVLVNYNNAKGQEILSLSDQIIADVSLKFDVHLEREVNIL